MMNAEQRSGAPHTGQQVAGRILPETGLVSFAGGEICPSAVT